MSLRPRYLLDTNICISLMKHQSPQVVERFVREVPVAPFDGPAAHAYGPVRWASLW